MKKFNHEQIILKVLSKFKNVKCSSNGRFHNFEGEGEHLGLLELIPASKKYFYTIYLNFMDSEVLDFIINEYKEQKKAITKEGFNVIIEDRMRNIATLI